VNPSNIVYYFINLFHFDIFCTKSRNSCHYHYHFFFGYYNFSFLISILWVNRWILVYSQKHFYEKNTFYQY